MSDVLGKTVRGVVSEVGIEGPYSAPGAAMGKGSREMREEKVHRGTNVALPLPGASVRASLEHFELLQLAGIAKRCQLSAKVIIFHFELSNFEISSPLCPSDRPRNAAEPTRRRIDG